MLWSYSSSSTEETIIRHATRIPRDKGCALTNIHIVQECCPRFTFDNYDYYYRPVNAFADKGQSSSIVPTPTHVLAINDISRGSGRDTRGQ